MSFSDLQQVDVESMPWSSASSRLENSNKCWVKGVTLPMIELAFDLRLERGCHWGRQTRVPGWGSGVMLTRIS